MKPPSLLYLLTIHVGMLSALSAEDRVAMVIGNNAYVHAKPLVNPIRDAELVGKKLEVGKWKVTPVKDAGILAMRKALREFCESAKGAEAAMVFYAGHGIEVKGKNYLLPVDAELSDKAAEDALPLETLPLDDLLQALGASGARLKIVVLDSCRDNPLSRSWLRDRSSGGGLAAVAEKAMAEGTMLVFSTAPGQVANDDSPFVTALVDRMSKGGSVADIFGDVAKTMGKTQEAWIRFDGSGRSFAAFRDFLLFADGASTPSPDDYALVAGKMAGERKLVDLAAGLNIPFRWCPPGTFAMGSPKSEQEEVGPLATFDVTDEVQHAVSLTKGFWIAETEVTQRQWRAIAGTTVVDQGKLALQDDHIYTVGRRQQTYRDWQRKARDSEPTLGIASDQTAMIYVNHIEAEQWCKKANGHANLRSWMVKLPTEAQWEYACRAGTSGMGYVADYRLAGPFNAPGLGRIAWYGGNSRDGYGRSGWDYSSDGHKLEINGPTAGPREVATREPNRWGIHDMLGNVSEWCADWKDAYPATPLTDPTGPMAGDRRVSRGGGWGEDAYRCRAADRLGKTPHYRDERQGFRPVLSFVP